MCDM
ncbi:hypothetical protein CISIN_1g0066371mg, partial [Citrus sinensis]